jgi:hypothetical protein
MFSWGVAAEYAYGETLAVNQRSAPPVLLGGQVNVVCEFPHTGRRSEVSGPAQPVS